jgi:hypothetical protein
MRLVVEAWGFVAVASVSAVVAAGCSSGLTPDGQYGAQCAQTARAGGFVLWLTSAGMDSTSGSAEIDGTVWDRPQPSFVPRTVVAAEGACALTEDDPGTSCTPSCAGDEVCTQDGTCVNWVAHSVGTVQLTGLDRPVSLEPPTSGFVTYSSGAGDVPYPGAAPGAAITLQTSGGDYAPFTLTAYGLTPLWQRAGALPVARDQPLTIEWNARSPQEPTRLVATVYLAGDLTDGGNVPGNPEIVCTFPDTGTGTVPASLLTRLIDLGVGSAPALGLERMTVGSTQIAPGCVDFQVLSQSDQSIVVQ